MNLDDLFVDLCAHGVDFGADFLQFLAIRRVLTLHREHAFLLFFELGAFRFQFLHEFVHRFRFEAPHPRGHRSSLGDFFVSILERGDRRQHDHDGGAEVEEHRDEGDSPR